MYKVLLILDKFFLKYEGRGTKLIPSKKKLPWKTPASLWSCLKNLTVKLTMFLALTSATRASEIGSLDIRYLIKHSSGYTFHFGKDTKTSKRSKARDPITFHILRKSKSVCLSMYWFILWKDKGNTTTNFTAPAKFCQTTHEPASTPTISKWIMIVFNLSRSFNQSLL